MALSPAILRFFLSWALHPKHFMSSRLSQPPWPYLGLSHHPFLFSCLQSWDALLQGFLPPAFTRSISSSTFKSSFPENLTVSLPSCVQSLVVPHRNLNIRFLSLHDVAWFVFTFFPCYLFLYRAMPLFILIDYYFNPSKVPLFHLGAFAQAAFLSRILSPHFSG